MVKVGYRLNIGVKKWLSMWSVAMICAGCGVGKEAPLMASDLALKADFRLDSLEMSWRSAPLATYYQVLQTTDGVSGYTPIGEPVYGTSADVSITENLKIPAMDFIDWSRARFAIRACNDAGCSIPTYTIPVGYAAIQAINYLKSPNVNASDFFGHAIAISADGNTLAIGAPGESNGVADLDHVDYSAYASGAVYVYTHESGIWVFQAYIKASNIGGGDSVTKLDGDRFGYSVALSADGNALVVGAPNEASGNGDPLDDSAPDTGAVYFFSRQNGNWSQQAYLKPKIEDAGINGSTNLCKSNDKFSYFVDVPANSSGGWVNGTIANNGAGSVGDTGGGANATILFARTMLFGSAIALSADGRTLAVGAPEDTWQLDTCRALHAGSVYIFSREADEWKQKDRLHASNYSSGNYFGHAVAMSGDGATLAVSAPYASGGAGLVYLFDKSGQWRQNAYVESVTKRETIYGQDSHGKFVSMVDGDRFGWSISLSNDGKTLAVGVPNESSVSINPNGNPGENTIDSIFTRPRLWFGGKAFYDAYYGAVFVYRRNDAWTQQAYIRPTISSPLSNFGWSVALSPDGNALAVGAPNERGRAFAINGNTADAGVGAWGTGAAYTFKSEGDTWTQLWYTKASNPSSSSQFGFAVSLAQHANVLAVGAKFEAGNSHGLNIYPTVNDYNLNGSGAAYLY